MEGMRVGVEELDPIGRTDLIEPVVVAVRAGGAICLVGEPGIGKTTVWRSCLDRLTYAHRWTFTCSEAEQQLGLTALAELFGWASPRDVDRLPPPQRRAVDVVLLRADADEAAADGRLLGMTTASLLAAIARSGPVLLAIDDLQWCDQSSLSALRFALRRLDPAAVTLFATRRPTPEGAARHDHDIVVEPLPPADVKRLLYASGPDLSSRVAARITDISGGNPLYALELARPLPTTLDEIRVPPSLRSLLSTRMAGLPGGCQDALLDLALRGSTDDADALAAAHAERIVVSDGPRVRFEHPLLAELVLEQATAAAVRGAHDRAAQTSRDAVQRARHLAAAAVEPDEDLAKELDVAVVEALRRGDVYSARDLADRALALTTPGHRPTHRLAALASCEGGVGRGSVARELALELLDNAALPGDRFVALMILADNPPASAALAYAADAASLAGIPADDRLQAVGLHAKVLFLSGHTQAARQAVDAALVSAPNESPAWFGLSGYLAVMTRLTGARHDERALELAVQADREGLLTPAGSALEIAGMLAMLDDRHDEARQFFAEATGCFAERGYGGAAGVFALMACRVGDLELARTLADRAVDEHGGRVPVRDAAMLAQVCAWQGDVRGVRRACDAADRAEQDVDVTARATLDCAAGFDALLGGDVRQAWDVLRKVCDTLEQAGFGEPSRVPALPLAIEAAAAMGELAAAERLCARLDSQARAVESRWARAAVLRSRGHIVLAQGDAPTAVELFDQAAEAYSAISLPLERARAVLAAGTALRRAGRRSLAQQRLLDCRRAFESAGAASLLRATDTELARLGGRSARYESVLTDAERQVAELAASGLRNAEIALRLHITAKTVENHLGKVYRKLGVRGRAELAVQRYRDGLPQ